jgi:hypothetical protein
MGRWQNLDDLIAVWQWQARGMQLDLERAVLWKHAPLQAALALYLPMNKIGAETIVLYPASNYRARAIGFAQMRGRHGRPETDIVFLAPALDEHTDAVSIWYRLLAECAQATGARGGQRLFAQVPSGNGIEEVFRQAGYSTYAHDDVYYCDCLPIASTQTNILRRQRARDGWNLLRLFAELTPRAVQVAEGMLSPEGQGGKMGDWWDQSRRSGFILEVDGELAGAVRIRRGQNAYWLRFGLHPQASEHADTLLHGALSLLRAAPRRPIYCSVRDYESGMIPALEQAGFQHFQTRSLLVKHMTARAKETIFNLMPALEKHAKPVHSVPHQTSRTE